MLKKKALVWAGALVILLAMTIPAMAEFGIGGGVYYNRQLGDIKHDKDFDKDFISYVISLKYQFADILGLEANFDYYNGNDELDYTFRPMGTAVLSIPLPILDLFNAGVGINSTYTKYKKAGGGSKSEWSKISYHFKAGIQIPIASILWICGDCYYFVDNLKDIEDFDSDLLTFGTRALIRF
ncbi:MAG: outer membrane beta-barrel protein [Candidatus Euphemobacter frigidus]|nr:outer membrane beta-barrel protein [Candidatus Euphemobacter frigidus]MDP8274949.1 outer membrane beta-barrel protein [Candidatus Euphemobacter frigidus]